MAARRPIVNIAGALREMPDGDAVPISQGGTGATNAASALTALGALPASDLIGSVIWIGKNSAPTGYLKCNGAAVSRTIYASLFTVIGTTFGTGDGSTTFNLPDLRGEFVRGWDDGRGVDSGRTFGSAQSQDIQTHSNDVGVLTSNAAGLPYNPGNKLNNATYATSDGAAYTTAYFNTTYLSASGQTRPRNIALLACIRYQ